MELNSEIKKLLKEKIIFGKYEIIKNIEKNNNLRIYKGKNIISGELILIKIEQKEEKKKKGILEIESYYFNYLKSPGIPIIKKIGYYDNYIISIQPLLGETLSQLFNKYYGIFKIKDITMIAIQILERIKFIHSKNIIYCDVNPNNFAIGLGRFQNNIYMTNFNLAKRYKNKNTLEHIKYNLSNKVIGDYIFSSINSLRGVELSRRDDLESFGYMLIYFLKGSLPWEHIRGLNKEEKMRKIYQFRKSYDLSDLCQGVPEEFKLFLNYVKTLTFMEEPDYNYCFSLFYGIFKKMNIINDGIFSWYQEKKKESLNKIKQFYSKLWDNKYFNNNTSTNSFFNEFKNDKNLLNKSEIINIKKSNSCFLNIHNSLEKILNNNNKINYSPKKLLDNISKVNYKNIKYRNHYGLVNMKSDISSNINQQLSIEIDMKNPNTYFKDSIDNNSISLSSDKEYSIEGKIEQDAIKNKAYEKKQIGIDNKKNFYKKKDKNKKGVIYQSDLMRIRKRITNNKKLIDNKLFINKINKNTCVKSVNKTFTNKDMSNKNLYNKEDMLCIDNKKNSHFVKSGNSSTKNNYIKNKIRYFTNTKKKKEYITFSNFSHLRNKTNKIKLIDVDLTNNIKNTNNKINKNENIKNPKEENNVEKKEKKPICLNIDNIISNNQRFSNNINLNLNKTNLYNNNFISKNLNYISYQNSLNNISNKLNEKNKPKLIKVSKKNSKKLLKKENTYNYNNSKIKKINIYEHKLLVNKNENNKTQTIKKYSGVLVNNSNKKISFNNTAYNSKKVFEKTYKNIPLSKKKDSSKKVMPISINKYINNKNKRIFSSMPSKKKTIENEINNIANNTEQYDCHTFKNSNTIFSNFNNINKNKKSKNEIYISKSKKLQNTAPKNNNMRKQKGFLPHYIKIKNSPIIHNSISKLNLIQNVSNIFVTKSYLEEKPVTERKNKVLIHKNKNVYVKPRNKASHDWTLLNRGNITNLILELNNRDNIVDNYSCGLNEASDNTQNYYISELNIFKEN